MPMHRASSNIFALHRRRKGRSVHIKGRITDAEMRAAVPMRCKAICCGMLWQKGADSNFSAIFIMMRNFFARTLIGISKKTYTVSAANIYHACHRSESDRKKFRSSAGRAAKKVPWTQERLFSQQYTALAAMFFDRNSDCRYRELKKIKP